MERMKPPPSPLSRFERTVRALGGTPSSPYDAGYDCGLNGANTSNCHFSFFGNRQRTAEWERGKAAGDLARSKRSPSEARDRE